MEKDHPAQAVDTEVPDGDFVNEEAWESMRANAEPEPEEEG